MFICVTFQPERGDGDDRKRKYGGISDHPSKKRGTFTEEDRENILKMVEEEPEVISKNLEGSFAHEYNCG